jgi:hypothetical protein
MLNLYLERSLSADTWFGARRVSLQEYVLLRVGIPIRIVIDFLHREELSSSLHEPHICPPSLFEAEVDSGVTIDK